MSVLVDEGRDVVTDESQRRLHVKLQTERLQINAFKRRRYRDTKSFSLTSSGREAGAGEEFKKKEGGEDAGAGLSDGGGRPEGKEEKEEKMQEQASQTEEEDLKEEKEEKMQDQASQRRRKT
ncbi:hypothetical protein F7725_029073 [Dissostichus mawsoni]|uniref:Uncharacterized protein n=1 Tax=Dissostichus mawsoni TaxID=36200 RepID=A0A7J5XHF8_DISMA|nr:hypothetical protein F7725_029073 [Dissostichus mawsoni]